MCKDTSVVLLIYDITAYVTKLYSGKPIMYDSGREFFAVIWIINDKKTYFLRENPSDFNFCFDCRNLRFSALTSSTWMY